MFAFSFKTRGAVRGAAGGPRKNNGQRARRQATGAPPRATALCTATPPGRARVRADCTLQTHGFIKYQNAHLLRACLQIAREAPERPAEVRPPEPTSSRARPDRETKPCVLCLPSVVLTHTRAHAGK